MATTKSHLLPGHILAALALACVAAVLPMGPLLMAVPWLIIVWRAARRESPRGRGFTAVATYAVVTAIVFAAAALAPVKTKEQVLDRPIELPKTELSLGEMDREISLDATYEWLPRYIQVSSTPENADHVVRFPARQLTVRDFVVAIESQSDLQHRFRHCGNGYSILYGGDCSFGLHLRPQRSR